MSHTIYRTLRCVVKVEAKITFSASPACRGSRGSYGEPLEPDEPASADIESITAAHGAFIVKGDDLELVDDSDDAMRELENDCLEELGERDQGAAEDAAIARAEARLDMNYDRYYP